MNISLGITDILTGGFGNAIYQEILKISPRIDLQWHLLHFLVFFLSSWRREGTELKKCSKAYKCCFPSRSVQGNFSFQEGKRLFLFQGGVELEGAGWGR